jgi:hypothetical protein
MHPRPSSQMAILNTSVVHQMMNLVESVLRRNSRHAAMPEVQRLSVGEVRSHAALRQTIVVIAGTVWVTVGGHDYVVQSGESQNLPDDPYPALVSSVNERQAIYRLCRQLKGDTTARSNQVSQNGRTQRGQLGNVHGVGSEVAIPRMRGMRGHDPIGIRTRV